MPTPTLNAYLNLPIDNPALDALHLLDKSGNVIGWIDVNGLPQGSLFQSGGGGGQGFGFESGTIVAGSTGNTPADGFTLDDGTGNTVTMAPLEELFTSTTKPGVIDLNISGGPVIKVGNQSTVAASTDLTEIKSDAASFVNTTNSSSVVVNNAGSVSIVDALGNAGDFGSPNGAGLTLNGAGGTIITSDGTIPSTTWNDGAGGTTQIFANDVICTDSNGDTGELFAHILRLTYNTDNIIALDSSNPTFSISSSTGAPS